MSHPQFENALIETKKALTLADHPNRHIREGLNDAESKGWTIHKSGPRAHAWGITYCRYGHRLCRMSIWSTPRNPQNHARAIRRKVSRCPEA